MKNNICAECNSKKYGFSYIHFSGRGSTSAPHIDKDLFSIFMLLGGNVNYDIEGKLIHISPDDILLVGNNELHRCIMNSNKNCEYLLLMVDLDFFIKNNCTEFAQMVFNRNLGGDNVIPADIVKKYGIADVFLRMDKYCREENAPKSVICGVIIELLYNLNKHVENKCASDYSPGKINDIIGYINDNVTEKISLDDIAKRFFLAKPYLCKIFKKNTGYTINRYVSYKRIALVRKAYSNGMSLSEACYKAGFNDYSSFYRAYLKMTNESPRKSLSKK